jgi:hypothetical protein
MIVVIHHWQKIGRLPTWLFFKDMSWIALVTSPVLHLSTGAITPLNNPAGRQSSASSEILVTTTTLEGVAPSKTTRFRWHHRHQQMTAIVVHKSWSAPGSTRFSCNKLTRLLSGCGVQYSLPQQRRQVAHNSRAKTQPIRRWSKVSSTWSHKGRDAGCGSPRLLNLAVQYLFFAAS